MFTNWNKVPEQTMGVFFLLMRSKKLVENFVQILLRTFYNSYLDIIKSRCFLLVHFGDDYLPEFS
jgi:hypothetical protein